ncbi:MAG: hypothetical protein MR945_01050 [Agathobacter sp.]|nr:hypothetical protein [Agathobacter sp.]
MRIWLGDGHMDKEALLLLAVAAFMAAIGLLALWGGCAGIKLENLGVWNVAGILAGLTGGIFGVFLLIGLLGKGE